MQSSFPMQMKLHAYLGEGALSANRMIVVKIQWPLSSIKKRLLIYEQMLVNGLILLRVCLSS